MVKERILICVSSRTIVFGARCIIPKQQYEKMPTGNEEDVPTLQLLQCVHLKLDHVLECDLTDSGHEAAEKTRVELQVCIRVLTQRSH